MKHKRSWKSKSNVVKEGRGEKKREKDRDI